MDRLRRVEPGGRSQRMLRLMIVVALATTATFGPSSTTSAHSPHDDVAMIQFVGGDAASEVVVALVRGRLMRSADRGETWSEIVNGLPGDADPLTTFAFSDDDPSVGFALSAGGTVVRSDDGGRNWSSIAIIDSPVRRLEVSPTDPDLVLALGVRSSLRSTDGGSSWEPTGLGRGPIVDARFLPDGRTVIGADAGGRALMSFDGGESWEAGGGLEPLRRPRTVDLVPRPGAPPLVLVGGVDGVLMRSDDGGASFEQVGEGLPSREIRALATTDGPSPTLWLTMWSDGPFRSTDLGTTWSRWSDGATTDEQASRRREPNWNIIAPAPDGSGLVLLGGFDGLFALDGPGDRVWREIETLDRYVAGLAVSPAFDADGTVVVTSYVRGAFLSEDGGDSWTPVNRGLAFPDNASSSFPVWRLHNVHMSPDFADDRTVFSSTWRQIIRSTDGGRSWERIDLPSTPDGSRPRLFVIAVAPDSDSDATVFAGTSQGTIYRSITNGDPGTWEILSSVPTRVRSIAVAPAEGGSRTMLVGTTDRLLRSIDGGRTWQRVAPGITASTTTGVQVALSPQFAADRTALAAASGGLYISRDGGVTWSRTASLEDGPIESAAFSPAFGADGTILVSVRGHGLRRSTDGGATFHPVGDELARANLLVADYAIPTSSPIQFSPSFTTDRTIFASAGQEVLRSTDGGTSWEVLVFPRNSEVRAALLAEQTGGNRLGLLAGTGVAAAVLFGLAARRPGRATSMRGQSTK